MYEPVIKTFNLHRAMQATSLIKAYSLQEKHQRIDRAMKINSATSKNYHYKLINFFMKEPVIDETFCNGHDKKWKKSLYERSNDADAAFTRFDIASLGNADHKVGVASARYTHRLKSLSVKNETLIFLYLVKKYAWN